jgi:hypothetical protein
LIGGSIRCGRDLGREQRDPRIGGRQVPPAVDHHGRVRLVALEHAVERCADRRHLRLVDRPLGVGGREPGGQQQLVAVAQRDVELLGEVQDHLAARPRAAGLQEAEVAGGHAGLEREVELAQPAAPAPVLQQRSPAGLRACSRCGRSDGRRGGTYLAGN